MQSIRREFTDEQADDAAAAADDRRRDHPQHGSERPEESRSCGNELQHLSRMLSRHDAKVSMPASTALRYDATPWLLRRSIPISATAANSHHGDSHQTISIAQLAGRGFVQQGFCNATWWGALGLTLRAGRRRNLIILRSIRNGSVEPLPLLWSIR